MAPVLASLEEVPGVIESRVDWTGRRFLLRISRREDVDAVVSQADEALGGGARRLDREAETQAANSFLRGTETWMRAGETLKLSRAEARILAEQHAREAASSAGLNEQQTHQLIGMLESEIAAAFERIHADGKGLPANLGDVCGEALMRTLERSRSFLSADQLQKVKEYCEARSGR